MFRGLRIAVAIATCTSSMPSAHAGPPPASEPSQPEEVGTQPVAPSEPPDDAAQPDPEPDVAAPPEADAPAADTPEGQPAEAEPSEPVDVAEPTPPPPTVPDRDVPDPDPEDGDPSYDVLRDAPEAVVARQRIIGGSIMLGVGLLLGAGAIAMGTSDPCSLRAGNSCNRGARTRAALALGIPGLAITAGGATLLGIGLHARAQLRAGVVVRRDEGGFVVQGRF